MEAQERLRLEERFWSKVNRGRQNECWEWTRARHPDGYGSFRWTNPITGKNEVTRASRVAFYLTYGYLPTMACHHCDNPPCCNPSCIYDGDAATNGADKAERGRAKGHEDQRGEKNASAVLTDELVIRARQLVKEGSTHAKVAELLGVQREVLTYAVTGRTWAHLDEIEAPAPIRKGGTNLTEDDVRTIRQEKAGGAKAEVLAERYGLTKANIYAIVSRKSWKHVV